ncbi:MAG: YcgN family cysteine cluster protein [Pseudomonadota bacterium]
MNSPLLELNSEQWEDLCDRCGRCCLVKLEDEDTGTLHYTNVACEFLDTDSCSCKDYKNRMRVQPGCIRLSPTRLDLMDIMPTTCAYRRLHEGRPLHAPQNLKVTGKVVSQQYVHDDQLPEHIVDWISAGSGQCS